MSLTIQTPGGADHTASVEAWLSEMVAERAGAAPGAPGARLLSAKGGLRCRRLRVVLSNGEAVVHPAETLVTYLARRTPPRELERVLDCVQGGRQMDASPTGVLSPAGGGDQISLVTPGGRIVVASIESWVGGFLQAMSADRRSHICQRVAGNTTHRMMRAETSSLVS